MHYLHGVDLALFLPIAFATILVFIFIVWRSLKDVRALQSQVPEIQVEYARTLEARQKAMQQLGFNPAFMSPKAVLESALADPSAWSLVVSNLLVIGFAWVDHTPALMLLWAYWLQSVIIGFYTALKMLTSENGLPVKFNGVETAVNWGGKLFTTVFFAFHYGMFHTVYAVFLGVEGLMGTQSPMDWGFLLPTTTLFFANHGYSFLKNRGQDKKKGLTHLMMAPYGRILPMHLTIIFGGAFFGIANEFTNAFTLLLFGGLKILADVIMHVNEHREPGPAG